MAILVEAGIDLGARTLGGQTALHFVAKNNHLMTEYLLFRGADVSVRDLNGYTALHWAVSVNEGNADTIRLLLKCVPLRRNLIDELTLLACTSGNLEVLRLLRQKEADLTSLRREMGRKTPLHIATYYNNLETVRYLLDGNFPADVRDEEGWTALHVSAARGYLEIAVLLVSSGADVNAKTFKGSSPLRIAVFNRARQLVEFLLVNGGDLNAVDSSGNTVLDTAVKINDEQTATYLKNRGAMPGNRIRQKMRQSNPSIGTKRNSIRSTRTSLNGKSEDLIVL